MYTLKQPIFLFSLLGFFFVVAVVAVVVDAGPTGYPRLDEQVCGKDRAELRDTLEAAIWLQSGHHGHVRKLKH